MSARSEGHLGSELTIRGHLRGPSDLRIDGIFEGQISLGGELRIGAEGSVSAPLEVGRLELEGELVGDVRASEAVIVRTGGRLIGNVRAPQIGVDDGGTLRGGIEMEFDLPAAEPA